MSTDSRELFVDPLVFALRARGGVARVWSHLLPRLVESDFAVRLIDGTDCRSLFANGWPEHAVAFTKVSRIPANLRRFVPFNGNRGVFFPTAFRPCRKGARNIQIVHDCIKELYYDPAKAGLARWRHSRIYENASLLIAISDATRLDLLRLYGERVGAKVKVIQNPIDFDHIDCCLADGTHQDEVERIELAVAGRPAAVYVGARGRIKNFQEVRTLLEAAKDHVIIVIGPPAAADELEMLGKHRPRVLFVGPVCDQVMFQLVRSSQYLFWPSLVEGFGMPVIESLYVGTPVLALDTEINREVAGGMLNTFRTGSVESIADALSALGRPGPDTQATLRARYAADRIAQLYIQAIQSVL